MPGSGVEVARAHVTIIPKSEGMSQGINKIITGDADKAGKSAGQKAGTSFADTAKKVIAAAAIGGTVIAGIKTALDEGGKLQQSFGGLETIYGDAADAAKNYAADAAKAGISANDYAEQAVSFGASLKQAFEGDTTKAVEAANTAIMDMTDNAAKMGTPLENIQNAYQGFAKQNYTMLDNLKLGYGGTKTEMERLLADATKLSGVEYNIDNLGDVYDAIHVIQEDLGLTGVAAEEASETFSGSLGAMQAAAKNLAAGLATGEGIEPAMQQLATSASDFLFKNLIPMVGNVIKQLPTVVKTFVTTGLPQFIAAGKTIITGLVNGVTTTIPQLVDKAPSLISEFGGRITEALPTILEKGKELILKIADGVLGAIPQLASTAGQIVTNIGSFISTNLPVIGEKGGELIQKLATGIINNLPAIITSIAKLGVTIVQNVVKIAPKLLKAGADLIKGLVRGIGNSSPVKTAMNKIKDAMMKPIETARTKIKGVMDRIKAIFPLNIGNVFSGLKLPHFSVSGGSFPWGIGGKGSMPSWSVSWYAKAMNTPYMFTQPTLIGAGEAGNEIMYGHDSLMGDIRSAVGSGGGDVTVNLNYDANDDANDMVRDLARGIRRYRMAGAI